MMITVVSDSFYIEKEGYIIRDQFENIYFPVFLVYITPTHILKGKLIRIFANSGINLNFLRQNVNSALHWRNNTYSQ